MENCVKGDERKEEIGEVRRKCKIRARDKKRENSLVKESIREEYDRRSKAIGGNRID